MSSKGAGRSEKSLKGTAFAQQLIAAWQPVLAPRWMTVTLCIVGLVFIGLGIILIETSNRVVECVIHYGDPACNDTECKDTVQVGAESCSGSRLVDEGGGQYSIKGPIYVYYGLTKFYQNHRRYMLSQSTAQLRGEIFTDPDQLKDCEPALMSADGYSILSPCGLAARSVFNDTFSCDSYEFDESAKTIVWPSYLINSFKNPPTDAGAALNKLDQWLDDKIFPNKVENPHFIVWMRNAALPDFRKMYAKITNDTVRLPMPCDIYNRYPASAFGGEKTLVFSTTSWMGGKNPFLGIVYTVLGSLFFLIGLFAEIKNRRNPRVLGDVRFLKWSKPKNQ